MTDGHRAHLFASLVAADELAAEMTSAGRYGRSPAGGQALTALTAEEWERIAVPLQAACDQIRMVAAHYAPERMAKHGAPEGRTTTLYWLSILLMRLQADVIADLEPARMERKFGELSTDELGSLAALIASVREHLAAARQEIDRLKSGKGDAS